MLIKVFNEIALNDLSQHQNDLSFLGRQITKLCTSNVCQMIINIFSYSFSVIKNLFVKWALGGPGFKTEVFLRLGYSYQAGHTES